MSYEIVNESYKKIDHILRTQYGGRGKFFADVLQSVESKLPRIVFIGLREVARVRNKLSHELEFGPDSIPPGFEELCTEIICRLHKKADSSSSGIEDARVKACCREMLRDGSQTVVLCGACGSIHRLHRTNHLELLSDGKNANDNRKVEVDRNVVVRLR